MTSIRDILEDYRIELEMRMRPQLDSMIRGSIVRAQLPQVWHFVTELEETSFIFDKQGNTKVSPGKAPDPDVTVEWKHEYLSSILLTRTLEGIPPGEEPKITVHSVKGRIGYAMMRKHLRFP